MLSARTGRSSSVLHFQGAFGSGSPSVSTTFASRSMHGFAPGARASPAVCRSRAPSRGRSRLEPTPRHLQQRWGAQDDTICLEDPAKGAKELGLATEHYLRSLVSTGRIKATLVDGVWDVSPEAVEEYRQSVKHKRSSASFKTFEREDVLGGLLERSRTL
jgi:hypothetical protein